MDIGLVLGGGGARCFAHLGVIRALEERGVNPTVMATCSTASVIGAFYATGHSVERILELTQEINFKSFLVFDPGGGGLVSSENIFDLLDAHVAQTFEALRIPLAVVTTDIQTGETLTFRSGDLAPAVCASNALPGVFEPVRHAGRYLLDGGVLNIVPVDVMREMTDAQIIAVDVTQSPKRTLELDDKSLREKVTPPYRTTPLALDILKKAYALRENMIRDAHYQKSPPDINIRPDLPEDFSDQDFGRTEEAVEIGYVSAIRVLDDQF